MDLSFKFLVQNGYEHLSSELSPSSRILEYNFCRQPGPGPGPDPSLSQRRHLSGQLQTFVIWSIWVLISLSPSSHFTSVHTEEAPDVSLD